MRQYKNLKNVFVEEKHFFEWNHHTIFVKVSVKSSCQSYWWIKLNNYLRCIPVFSLWFGGTYSNPSALAAILFTIVCPVVKYPGHQNSSSSLNPWVFIETYFYQRSPCSNPKFLATFSSWFQFIPVCYTCTSASVNLVHVVFYPEVLINGHWQRAFSAYCLASAISFSWLCRWRGCCSSPSIDLHFWLCLAIELRGYDRDSS